MQINNSRAIVSGGASGLGLATAEKIIELGSGRVLTGIAKRMIENISAKSFENPEDYKDLISFLGDI